MTFTHPIGNTSFPNQGPSRETILAQIPTAIEAYARSNLTLEQIENQAFPIIMGLAQSINQNVYRQRATYNFPDTQRYDATPKEVAMYVARFFEERGYHVLVMDIGIAIEWSNPHHSKHDDRKASRTIHTTEERTVSVQELPDGSVQFTGVQGQVIADHGEPLPRYTIGTGDRSVTRKP